MNLKPACGRAFLWRQYASTYFRRTEGWYGNAGTELHHSAEDLPDQYDGGREYGGIRKSG